eukprot:COSAG02_NODE_1435_length_12610_cov_7.021181_16_plen_64_part_01
MLHFLVFIRPRVSHYATPLTCAVGGGPLGEWWRLTVCSADPTVPHQAGASAVIRAHRCVGRELV